VPGNAALSHINGHYSVASIARHPTSTPRRDSEIEKLRAEFVYPTLNASTGLMPDITSVAGLGSKVLVKQFGDPLCQVVGDAQVLAEKVNLPLDAAIQ
jgi:hypothetical protein